MVSVDLSLSPLKYGAEVRSAGEHENCPWNIHRLLHEYVLGCRNTWQQDNEKFSDEMPNRDGWEVFVGTELNLRDLEEVDLLVKLDAYPGLTERRTFRADFTRDAEFDLPLDF